MRTRSGRAMPRRDLSARSSPPACWIARSDPPLGEALARFAHERDGLGEDRGHHLAQLLRLLIGGALDVEPVHRRHRHVDGELDGVVGPSEVLGTLHLLGHLLETALEVRIIEEATEAFHALERTAWRLPAGPGSPASSRAQRPTVRRRPR